ncbi:Homoserine dehydrogenase [Chitinispirillum alkaliphilum]|nr:Homoserine dehydrogenase [Chitinispirillum alkaliphilum]
MQEIRIGLVGAGTVGGGVVKILNSRGKLFNSELGAPLVLARVVDKDERKVKDLPVGSAVCSSDFSDILEDETISVVVELVGGTTFAKKVVLDSLNRGKHVVTANKALVAEHGPEIFETAQKNGVSVYFEASVGGGMPIIKSVREGLIGNDIVSIKTIINGTCNYILTRMTAEGLPFDEVLKEAQARGYAEADPTLDIGGGDTAHKVTILASLVSGGYVPFENVYCEGITSIRKEDIEFATELGYTIKLLGVIKKSAGSKVEARVHPVMLHADHILTSVSNEFNAVLLEGDSVGPVLLYGKGAGEMPTASAVISDIIDTARNIISGHQVRIPMEYYSSDKEVEIFPVENISGRYYLRFTVADKPGVLADITKKLGMEKISIASVMQEEGHADHSVPVIILTHTASEKGIRNALADIEKSNYIRSTTQVIRIED